MWLLYTRLQHVMWQVWYHMTTTWLFHYWVFVLCIFTAYYNPQRSISTPVPITPDTPINRTDSVLSSASSTASRYYSQFSAQFSTQSSSSSGGIATPNLPPCYENECDPSSTTTEDRSEVIRRKILAMEEVCVGVNNECLLTCWSILMDFLILTEIACNVVTAICISCIYWLTWLTFRNASESWLPPTKWEEWERLGCRRLRKELNWRSCAKPILNGSWGGR